MSGSNWQFRPAADHGLGPVERLRSVKREPGLVSHTAHAAATTMLRAYFRVYHRLVVHGREHLPRQTPFIVIANHESHLDALVLAAALPRTAAASAYPVAAGDVFFERVAVSAFAAMFINALPLWRKKATKHALDELRARLGAGDSGYILFPEGARTRDGAMMPFKAGLGMLVAGTPVPVVPCFLDGPFRALAADAKLPRPVRIEVRVGPALRFDQTPNEKEGWLTVAAAAREAVEGLAR